MMVTIFFTALVLYLYGLPRTAVVFLGCVLTIVTVVMQMVAGGGLSFLFWPEWMRTFEAGEFWTTSFCQRAAFELWEAPAIPLIFLLDLVRVAVRLAWSRPTVFTIGFFLLWLYSVNMMWGVILRILQGISERRRH